MGEPLKTIWKPIFLYVSEAYEPSIDNVSAGNYPIARPLYIYTVGEPEGIVKEYIDWVKTGGQDALQKEGFVPLAKWLKLS